MTKGICEHCRSAFMPTHIHDRYCSPWCRAAAADEAAHIRRAVRALDDEFARAEAA